MLAMLMKRFLSTIREWMALLIHVLISILITVIMFVAIRPASLNDLPELEFSLDSYNEPVTVVSGSGKYKQGYIDILKDESRLYDDIGSNNVTDYVIHKITENEHTAREHYILGTTFDEELIYAFFNNEPLHSPPLALSMAVNTVVRTKLDSSYSIRLTNHPFPFRMESKVSMHFEIITFRA